MHAQGESRCTWYKIINLAITSYHNVTMSGTRIRVDAGGEGGYAASGRNSPTMRPTSTSTSTPHSTLCDAFFKDVDSEFCKLTSFEVLMRFNIYL